jgi:hypothetical protein
MFKEKKEQIVKVSYEGGTQSFLNNASKALRVSLRLRGVGPTPGAGGRALAATSRATVTHGSNNWHSLALSVLQGNSFGNCLEALEASGWLEMGALFAAVCKTVRHFGQRPLKSIPFGSAVAQL